MALRIAFDLDGTVADMHTVLRTEADRLFGARSDDGSPAKGASEETNRQADADVPLVVAGDDLNLTRDQMRMLWDHVCRIENFWTTLPEMEAGIVARIAGAARARQWHVVFITTRPATAGDTTQVQTQRWLHAHGFEYPSVCVLRRSRGKLADVLELDVVVDDRHENCLDVAIDSKATPLLMWPAAPESLPAGLKSMGVRPMASIGAAVTWLEALDDRNRSGPLRTLRRWLTRSE